MFKVYEKKLIKTLKLILGIIKLSNIKNNYEADQTHMNLN